MMLIRFDSDAAILVVDPYNELLSEGGKLWPTVKSVALAVDTVEHMRAVIDQARIAGSHVVFVPHHRTEPRDFDGWLFATPAQLGVRHLQAFERGTWGAEFHPAFRPRAGDIVAQEHWGQNGFAHTDLDRQLKQHGVQKVVLIGMAANTCIEGTARYAMELGYHVTLVTDATAAVSADRMHAAHALNGPDYAHSITDTDTLLRAQPL